jgi:CubicO group peptidase (beta-lactamase class C family)
LAKLSERIDTQAKISGFSGVISISEHKQTIYHRAFGYRDVRNKLADNIHTAFGIASGTKLFTALGVGKLIDKGLLSLQPSMEEMDKVAP